MKTKAICLIGIIFLAGGQQGQTLDSLNMRCIFQFHGDDYLAGLAMAPDTTLWTCYSGTDTLIQIDASDPEAIDTNFFAIDTTLIGIAGVIDDSMLIAWSFDGANYYFRIININLSPPSVISSYSSPYLSNPTYGQLVDTLYFNLGFVDPWGLAIFDLSDPTNIDTFCTSVANATGSYYVLKDSFLYAGTFTDTSGTGPMYNPTYYVRILNIADPYNPVYDTTCALITEEAYGPLIECPAVIHDTLMFVAANYEEMVVADVYNISDPIAPVYVGQLGPNTYLDKYCMIYENDYLYAGAWIKDMKGYPDNDSLVGYAVGAPQWMEVCGKYLYRITGASFVAFEFYEFDTTRLAINENPPAKPAAFAISAHPNPFNSAVTITIDGVGAGFTPACVEIYDVNGRRVETVTELVEVPVGAGLVPARGADSDVNEREGTSPSPTTRHFTWSPAPSLPSGVYLIRARFDGESVAKRVVYLK